MCGHRLLIKKQKPDTVKTAVGFVLILILGSHALLDRSLTLTSALVTLFIYLVKMY